MFTTDLMPFSSVYLALEPIRAMSDYVAGQTASLTSLPQGDGHPVIVFPGLGMSGAQTADMRGRLQQLGYVVYDWTQGVNNWPDTDFDEWLSPLGQHLEEVSADHGCTVSIVGWSLGGIYARELAKRHPALVRQVITLGTPRLEKSNSAEAEWAFSWLGTVTSSIDDTLLDSLSTDPAVPSTSIYSQTDGVVAWQSCMRPESSLHRNIKVNGVGHMGLVHHPEVLRVVAGLLAQP